jgi:hypothetical protein
MHPVFAEGLAAEHIKAMTQVAERARLVRQARRASGAGRWAPRS